MAIPDYQTLMLPVLQLLGDGQVRRVVPEVTDPLGEQFHLTPEDHAQKLQSGVQTTFVNRTHWATTYLSKAGLLSRPSRGRVAITDLGQQALAMKPAKIDVKFLMEYSGFEAFRAKAKPQAGSDGGGVVTLGDEQNPEELLYRTYDALRQSIEADMLDRLQAPGYPWESFERLVVDLLGAMDYGSSTDETRLRVTKLTGDEGIDGIIDEDKLGLDAVYVQAKSTKPRPVSVDRLCRHSRAALRVSALTRASSSRRRSSRARLKNTFDGSAGGSSLSTGGPLRS